MGDKREWRFEIDEDPKNIGYLIQTLMLMNKNTVFQVRRTGKHICVETSD